MTSEDRLEQSTDCSKAQADCRYCGGELAADEDEAHNHGICSACWSESQSEMESQR